MSRKARNLLLTAALTALVGVLLWNLTGGVGRLGGAPGETRGQTTPEPARAPDPRSPGGRDRPPAALDAPSDPETRLYAVAVTDLQGLPPDAPPGTRLELWVAWDPPITRKPKIQRLLREVTLDEIIPAITPDGPNAAILRLQSDQIGDLLYGDRYGSLSVTVLPGHSSP